MKVIVGLGNPGVEYALTRHNAGVMLVDRLAERLAAASSYGWRRRNNIMVWESPGLVLAKTADIFMNESARIIHDLRYMKYDLRDVYAAHDDLDIKLGEYKIQRGVGPKLHSGVQSIEGVVRDKNFWHIRIGVDNRDPSNRTPGEEYVLQKFMPGEKVILENTLDAIIKAINTSQKPGR